MKQGEEKLNGKLVVLFIVVIACSLAIQAGLALEKTALNPDYYRSLLGDPGLQQSIYSHLWQGITGQEKLPGDDSAVYQAFCRSFDEQWLSKQLDQAITGALHFIKGAEQQLTITLDIAEQKEAFRRELLRLVGQPETSALAASLEAFLREDIVPDRYLLISIESPDALDPQLSQSLAALQQARLWFKFVPYLTYGLLLLLALSWGGFESGLKWYGGGILTSGVIFALGSALLPETVLIQPLVQKSTLLKTIFTAHPDLVVKAIASAQGTLLHSALLQAAVGLVIIGAGFVVGRIGKKA